MKGSTLFAALIGLALMGANLACACGALASPQDEAVHHHAAAPAAASHHHAPAKTKAETDAGHKAESAPCPHRDCDHCDDLLDSCATPEYSLSATERGGWMVLPDQAAPDDPDLDATFIDTGQPWAGPPDQQLLTTRVTSWQLRADSPILRKDQLTE